MKIALPPLVAMMMLGCGGVPPGTGGGPPADGAPASDAGFAVDAGLVADGGGAPDAGAPDAGAPDAGASTVRSWIGGACSADDDCAAEGGRCLTGGAYPGGTCTLGCSRLCPDRAGDPVTFCIDNLGVLPESDGRCVARCDYARFATGCREGYACVIAARAQESDVHQSVCLSVDRTPGSAPLAWSPLAGGRQARVSLDTAPYPHASRLGGYTTSGGAYYPYAGHYDDPTALLVVPDGFVDTGATDFVVYFHGHNSSVDESVSQQELPAQFLEAGRNGVLVLVQGPKNAPDSGIGKLQEPGGFRNLITEVTGLLYDDGLVSQHRVGRLAVTGFSGGYYAAALSVDIGAIRSHVDECYLLDSFYGSYDRFFRYVSETQGRLISIVTAHLAGANTDFMARLDGAGIPYSTRLEDGARLTFLRTDVAHTQVPVGNFQRFLETFQAPP